MLFTHNLFELIQSRCSWRSYADQEISAPTITQLQDRLSSLPPTPFGTTPRLAIVANFGEISHQPVKLGTYGVIRGARNFLAGIIRPGVHSWEDFGFVFEWAILQATDLNLSTCWLGGTLKRDAFADAAGAQKNELVAAASPIGYPAAHRSLVDTLLRWGAGSKNRRPWEELFFANTLDTPLSRDSAGPWAKVLDMVRWAPSASNRQPWRIVYQNGLRRFDFFLQRTKFYDSLTAVDLQKIDMGIALCHFEFSCRALGLSGKWQKIGPPVSQLPNLTESIVSWIID
jgi:nitroreductase